MAYDFKLSEKYLDKYKNKKPPFGFNGLGELVFRRTYSRIKDNGVNEEWYETVARVVSGCYSIQKRWVNSHGLGWDESKAQRSAKEMYDRMWNLLWLPGGRGVYAMGSRIVEEKGLFAALYNCKFLSSKDMKQDPVAIFADMADASMCGIGVGFDCLGAGSVEIKGPSSKRKSEIFVIADSREGWVESISMLLESYFYHLPVIEFDYESIRGSGVPLKTFGGFSSGAQPLIDLHSDLRKVLDTYTGEMISTRNIVDIMNLIGKCVVSGNVRRSAQIAFSGINDDEFLNLKNYKENPEREEYGWLSNNSLKSPVGPVDYEQFVERIKDNGEPGFAWLDNVHRYGRMIDGVDASDHRVVGFNPCQPAWATVLTRSGIKRIGDLKIGESIWDGRNYVMVSNIQSSGIQPVYAYITKAATFYGTSNHRVVCQGIKVEASRASSIDICVGPQSANGEIAKHKIGKAFQVHALIWAKDIAPLKDGQSATVQIPNEYLYGNSDKACLFLRGLYSTSGSMSGGTIVLRSHSLELLKEVQIMLSALAIRSCYVSNELPDCELHVTVDRSVFYRKIGFLNSEDSAKLWEALDTDFSRGEQNSKIVETKALGDQEVFDITVESDAHVYWTGGVLVSNCGEIPLESWELCNLNETFIHRHKDLADFKRTLKYAYLYSKTVALGNLHWPESNRVILRNRRIGCSITGVAQFIDTRSVGDLIDWCDAGYKALKDYDAIYSDWFCVAKSIRLTTIKPSGSVSLLAGATPGMHFPEFRYYIRRMRLSADSALVKPLQDAGYKMEPAVGNEKTTVVVEIPIALGDSIRTVKEVSMWEQFSIAAILQKYWSDNSVSCTISFDPKTEGEQIAKALTYFQYQLKSVSLLPRVEGGSYKQMPYEAIEKAQYDELMKGIKPIKYKKIENELVIVEQYCDNDSCVI